jgi:ribosomal protein L16 Arg81 hydroxylase
MPDVTHDPRAESRIVSFDLIPKDPDYYFVLTEALREFAARQHAEAEDEAETDPAESRWRWAKTAEAMLDQIEKTLSAPAAVPDDLTAFEYASEEVGEAFTEWCGSEGIEARDDQEYRVIRSAFTAGMNEVSRYVRFREIIGKES